MDTCVIGTIQNWQSRGMTSKIPLTFIIPSYGRQAKLERAISSILSQEAQPEEIIVVDDASLVPLTLPGSFVETNRVRIIRQPENRGPAVSRNIGMRAARTDWVSFLDSDDWLLPGTLHRRWKFLEDSERSAPVKGRTIYGCGWQDVQSDGKILRERIPFPANQATDFFSGCWFSPGSCIILNQTLIVGVVGGSDCDLRRLEDYEWFLRIGLAGFELKIQSIIGTGIERGNNTNFAAVTIAAKAIRQRVGALTPNGKLRRAAAAYLYYEQAASAWRERRLLRFVILMFASFIARPRWSIFPMPGWRILPGSAIETD